MEVDEDRLLAWFAESHDLLDALRVPRYSPDEAKEYTLPERIGMMVDLILLYKAGHDTRATKIRPYLVLSRGQLRLGWRYQLDGVDQFRFVSVGWQ